jgi:hypothetical protein
VQHVSVVFRMMKEIRLVFEQEFCQIAEIDIYVPQRRKFIVVACINICLALEKQLCHGIVTSLDRKMQRRVAISVSVVYISVIETDHRLGTLDITVEDRIHETFCGFIVVIEKPPLLRSVHSLHNGRPTNYQRKAFLALRITYLYLKGSKMPLFLQVAFQLALLLLLQCQQITATNLIDAMHDEKVILLEENRCSWSPFATVYILSESGDELGEIREKSNKKILVDEGRTLAETEFDVSGFTITEVSHEHRFHLATVVPRLWNTDAYKEFEIFNVLRNPTYSVVSVGDATRATIDFYSNEKELVAHAQRNVITIDDSQCVDPQWTVTFHGKRIDRRVVVMLVSVQAFRDIWKQSYFYSNV